MCLALGLLELLVMASTLDYWNWLEFTADYVSVNQVILYLPQNGISLAVLHLCWSRPV